MNIREKESHWNERASWGSIAMTSSDWARKRMNSHLESGKSWEEALSALQNESSNESAKLVDKVINIINCTLQLFPANDSPHNIIPNILEVGIGIGDLTIPLLTQTTNNYNFFAVECSDKMLKRTLDRAKTIVTIEDEKLKRIKKGLATDIDKHTNIPFRLIIWGKLGHHLVQNNENGISEWELAIEKMKLALEPGGYFLQYEPMRELNPTYKANSKQKKWSFFRTLDEYQHNLYPLSLVENSSWNFCEEIYTIALWKKPYN